MMYHFCRFRGYLIVVYTNQRSKALRQLVKYVRETKGNLGYSENEIVKQAQIDVIDFIDDLGHLSALSNIATSLKELKREYSDKLDEKLREIERVREALRRVSDIIDEESW